MANQNKRTKRNLVHYAITAILVFILLSSALSFWNRHVTYDTRSIIDNAAQCKALTSSIQDQLLDKVELSVTAYMATGDPQKAAPLKTMAIKKDSIFDQLTTLLTSQHFDASDLIKIKTAVNDYIRQATAIVGLVTNHDSVAVKAGIASFQFSAQSLYETFSARMNKFENELEAHAHSDYEWSITDNAIIQIILIILSVPILIITSRRLKNEEKKNEELIKSLDESNREYFFHEIHSEEINAQSVIQKLIGNFKKAVQFVDEVSAGNYRNTKVLIPESSQHLNQKTLMGALVNMSAKLQAAEAEDQKRQWSANGLNQFYEVLRNNQGDFATLIDKSVSFLTKYLSSLQGALFIVERKEDQVYLELRGCYAYDRKKWIEKRIAVGEGMVGQVFLEKATVMLTELPPGYTSISSGLGEATPSCLLLVPFQFNEKIEAIFELSGFVKFEKHHIEFMEKAGELLASTLQYVRNNEEMQALLQQSKEQAESLRAQEEELRQNMEELEATNESIRRKEIF